jgi:hypothetical protein
MNSGDTPSVRSIRNLDEVIAELCLDRSEHGTDIARKNDFVEFGHHLAAAEFAQITTAST